VLGVETSCDDTAMAIVDWETGSDIACSLACMHCAQSFGSLL
jgi:tRNA A37 threonylcarbamoyltransferase TsaD